MAELFGFSIKRARSKSSGDNFTTPTPDDGSIEVAGGGFFSSILDTDGRERTELDLIRRYRDIAQQPECDSAIEDIVNETISYDEVSGRNLNITGVGTITRLNTTSLVGTSATITTLNSTTGTITQLTNTDFVSTSSTITSIVGLSLIHI